jgi:hypothetical protein
VRIQDRPGFAVLPGVTALDKCQDEPCSWDLVRKKGITISRQMPKANHLFNTTNIGDLYIIAKLICKKFYKKFHVFC